MTQAPALPKYALYERERRWMVLTEVRPSIEHLSYAKIVDRYISGTRIRLRSVLDSNRGITTYKLTKKYESPNSLARPIVTAYLSESEYYLLSKLDAYQIVKTRYQVDGFSLDVFEDKLSGLELAEIEAVDDDCLRKISPLGWFGREVSHDPDFEGAALAKRSLWRQ